MGVYNLQFFVLNLDFEAIGLIDVFESSIWTERYNECGDFELYTPVTAKLISILQPDYYLTSIESSYTMIIETVTITTDIEQGDHITATGRSLESILDRRIIEVPFNTDSYVHNAIGRLLSTYFTGTSLGDRRIPNLIYNEPTDPAIKALRVNKQWTGDNVYDVIVEICKLLDLGFKIELNSSNQFVFSLYMGADLTYDQTMNPYVIFSPKFENMLNSNYLYSKSNLKTVAYVAGEGEGTARFRVTVPRPSGGLVGLYRREMYVDARDVRSEDDDGNPISDSEYISKLTEKGYTELAENTIDEAFSCEIEPFKTFVYGEDYFIGDVVQLENEFGMKQKCRVMEYMRSTNTSGNQAFPTFVTI